MRSDGVRNHRNRRSDNSEIAVQIRRNTHLAATNGLVAGTTAVEHRLLLPVSASMMDVGGTYRFVLHVVDDHAVDYRDHRLKRPAFDLNAQAPNTGVWLCTGSQRDITATGLGLAWRTVHRRWLWQDYPNWMGNTRFHRAVNAWSTDGQSLSDLFHQFPNVDRSGNLNRVYNSMRWGDHHYLTQPGQIFRRHSPPIWVYLGHAVPNGNRLMVGNGQYIGAAPAPGMPQNTLFISTMVANALGYMRLGILAGCATGGYGQPNTDALPREMVQKGAKVVLAFDRTVPPRLADDFVKYLFCGGADPPPF